MRKSNFLRVSRASLLKSLTKIMERTPKCVTKITITEKMRSVSLKLHGPHTHFLDLMYAIVKYYLLAYSRVWQASRILWHRLLYKIN